MSDLAALATTLHGLLGPGVGIGVTDPKAPKGTLWPKEALAVARAVPKRHLEFTAGRVAARAAMTDIGLPSAPVLQGPDRAPIWPDGLIGSIAHCSTTCIAAVARSGPFRSIGIDIEEATPLDPDLWDTILTLSERAWLTKQPVANRGLLAKQIFSAKEATYKAQYPLTGQLIGFDAVNLSSPSATGSFAAEITLQSAKPMSQAGQIKIIDKLILSCCLIR